MDHPIVLPLTETWQSRAKESRAASTRLRCADARRRMLAAAEDFERLAMRRPEKGGPLTALGMDSDAARRGLTELLARRKERGANDTVPLAVIR